MLSEANSDEICYLALRSELNKKDVNYGFSSILRQPLSKENTAESVVGDDRIWLKPYALLGHSEAYQQEFLSEYILFKEKQEGINVIVKS